MIMNTANIKFAAGTAFMPASLPLVNDRPAGKYSASFFGSGF